MSALPLVMRLCCAVPKATLISSVPAGLLFHKSRLRRTRSESTLPQVLIPLHFKSFRSNTYKIPGEGATPSSSKVWQLATSGSPHLRAQHRPELLSAQGLTSQISGYPGWGACPAIRLPGSATCPRFTACYTPARLRKRSSQLSARTSRRRQIS